VWLTSPTHARWLEAEGDRLLDFGRASRHPAEGFGWLDTAGEPDFDRPVELWLTCRMTHVYSLAHLLGRPWAGALADHGVSALTRGFRDSTNGGWYAAVWSGRPISTDKMAYEHAFVVLAAASATAAGRTGGRALLDDALGVLLGRFWDDEYGMVVEQWDESFGHLDRYRGVNSNMHTVEALLSAADVLDDPSLREKAERIVARVVHDLAANNSWRIPEHFDSSWTLLFGRLQQTCQAGPPVTATSSVPTATSDSPRNCKCAVPFPAPTSRTLASNSLSHCSLRWACSLSRAPFAARRDPLTGGGKPPLTTSGPATPAWRRWRNCR